MPLCALLPLMIQAAVSRPILHFANPEVQARLGVPFEDALRNLLDINTVPYDAKVYNRTGLMQGDRFIRAGGGYEQPWTRDAAINSWNAASLIAPALARDTLWAATTPDIKGVPIVQRDNQWWDKVIWVVGAWNHYRVTGDRAFLNLSYGVADRLLHEMRSTRFDAKWGLYQGPSFFNDGIAGYPSPPAARDDAGSSFVLDHPGAEHVMALSTNCLYVGAFRAAAEMAKELGQPNREWNRSAEDLKRAINLRFWMPTPATYGYLLSPDGKLDPAQEGSGLAFAALFEVASPSRGRSILKKAHVEPYGVVDVYPHFPRFSDERPGRHNVVVWPMVQGMWVRAAAKLRDAESLKTQTEMLAGLVSGSQGHFFEIYNSKTGKPDGGWQNNHRWDSAPDQTWSATAYIGMIADGLFGMRFTPKGLRFEPTVPKGWGDVTLTGIPYRNAVLNLTLRGSGSRVRSLLLDGKNVKAIPTQLNGPHSVDIDVE